VLLVIIVCEVLFEETRLRFSRLVLFLGHLDHLEVLANCVRSCSLSSLELELSGCEATGLLLNLLKVCFAGGMMSEACSHCEFVFKA
jgi:hypothetical protein